MFPIQFNSFWRMALLGSATLLLIGCSDVNFGAAPEEVTTEAEPTPPPTETVVTLKTLQPALAVRGIACLMCHADVRANVITDFGYGESWYMGGANHFDGEQSWYNNLASTWQTAQVQGSVIVPDALVTRKAQDILGAAFTGALIKIDQFMNTNYNVTWNHPNDPLITNSAMTLRVQPAAGNTKVISKATVKIRAPSEQEILNLSASVASSASDVAYERVGAVGAVQLVQVGTGAQVYLTNSGQLECSKSDIVIKGTLFLKDLTVNAAGGCRLYVTGTVFIQGAITYTGGADQNLQISSANAIVMGIGQAKLQNRLVTDVRGLQIGGTRTYSDRASQTLAEAAKITGLQDAEDVAPRLSYNYDGILLNAPLVHSRYLGQVHGTIIAEAALFALGAFHFDFDPVFTKVDVLPLLTDPVLSVK
ncbi:MAG: hypothetical protein ABL958_15575 [Bdellovibrionia bacterium]